MARILSLQLGVIGLAGTMCSACASTWPDQTGLPPAAGSVPAPYLSQQAAPRPAFEFERSRQVVTGPAFREDRSSSLEEQRTAERLADFQRTTAILTDNRSLLEKCAQDLLIKETLDEDEIAEISKALKRATPPGMRAAE